MSQVDVFMAAVRNEETGSPAGNYRSYRGPVREGRVVGAYGFATDFWDRLAGLAGLEGADWHDPKVQDKVARASFQALYDKYQDWRLVAIAWKGGAGLADAVAADPAILDNPHLTPVKSYAQKVMRHASAQLKQASPDSDGEPIPTRAFRIGLKDLSAPVAVAGSDEKGGEPSTQAAGGGLRPPLPAQDALTSMLRARRNQLRDRVAQADEVANAPLGTQVPDEPEAVDNPAEEAVE